VEEEKAGPLLASVAAAPSRAQRLHWGWLSMPNALTPRLAARLVK
jgi:hypothetical protein